MAKTMQNRTKKCAKSIKSWESILSQSILKRSLESLKTRSISDPCTQKRLWTSMIMRKESLMKVKIRSRLQTILSQNRSEKLIQALRRPECLVKSTPFNLKMNKKRSNKAENYKLETREFSRAKISLIRSSTKDLRTTQVLVGSLHPICQIRFSQRRDNLPVNFHLAMRSMFLLTTTQSLKRIKYRISQEIKSLTIQARDSIQNHRSRIKIQNRYSKSGKK